MAEWLVWGDEEALAQLLMAFRSAQRPLSRHVSLAELIEAYTTAGYWYAISKDRKRTAANGEKTEAQLAEDYMEALVKGLDKAIMATMHVGKQERYGG